MLSGNNITGTASTGYSIAQGAADIFQAILNAAYNDIRHYYQSDGTMRLVASYTDGLINWYEASIDWDTSGYRQFGAEHVFATWVHSVGLGNGTSVLNDPDPSTPCP
ncbi:hypothetical protein MNBD_GAMMA01-2201 [hydrothermal vent metagenome]|uniref:Uncharacterized protein n=1 Tax=hydrothermal vent metagenome TaxID=652676 RepID=A0A3B0VIA3_9ZZZZ